MTSPESGSREREHREEHGDVRSWWRCVPIADARHGESEAVERFAEALIRAVEHLPAVGDYSEGVETAAVLALIERLTAPPATPEEPT
jgi:hypothetical protein